MEDKKMVYTVEEIQAMLRIGRRQAYELVKSGAFKVVKVGPLYRIPKKAFDEWLCQVCDDDNSTINNSDSIL